MLFFYIISAIIALMWYTIVLLFKIALIALAVLVVIFTLYIGYTAVIFLLL